MLCNIIWSRKTQNMRWISYLKVLPELTMTRRRRRRLSSFAFDLYDTETTTVYKTRVQLILSYIHGCMLMKITAKSRQLDATVTLQALDNLQDWFFIHDYGCRADITHFAAEIWWLHVRHNNIMVSLAVVEQMKSWRMTVMAYSVNGAIRLKFVCCLTAHHQHLGY